MFELGQNIDEVISIIQSTVSQCGWLLHRDDAISIYNTSRTSLFITCVLSPSNAICSKILNLDSVDKVDNSSSTCDEKTSSQLISTDPSSMYDHSYVLLQEEVVQTWKSTRQRLLGSVVGLKYYKSSLE